MHRSLLVVVLALAAGCVDGGALLRRKRGSLGALGAAEAQEGEPGAAGAAGDSGTAANASPFHVESLQAIVHEDEDEASGASGPKGDAGNAGTDSASSSGSEDEAVAEAATGTAAAQQAQPEGVETGGDAAAAAAAQQDGADAGTTQDVSRSESGSEPNLEPDPESGGEDDAAAAAPPAKQPAPHRISCGAGVELDVADLDGLFGYAACQSFCVDPFDTSQAPYAGNCTVDGEEFLAEDVDADAATVFPAPLDASRLDVDPKVGKCGAAPAAHVTVPGFWTEELATSSLGDAADPSAPMRLPAGRSGHTVTRVVDKVLVFGGEKASAGCLSTQGEELLMLDLATMKWSAPTVSGTQPHLSGHTSTLVMLPRGKGESQWHNLSATPDAPHLFVLGGKAKDCEEGASSYSSALHVLNVETRAWSRKSAQADFVDNDALDSWDGREGHSATLVGAYIYVFGGVNDETGFTGKNDLLRLGVRPEAESGKFVWTILQRGGDAAPSARRGHVAALLSARYFVITGGFDDGNSVRDDVWVYDHGKSGTLGDGCSSFLSQDREGAAGDTLGDVCKWSRPALKQQGHGGLVGDGPLPREGASGAVMGERTAVSGNAQLLLVGGHDDSLATYYNDAWLLRVHSKPGGAADQTKGSPNDWYWQQVSMDNGDLASDTDMQIPERRSDMGMVYIPSYVHMLSLGDAAFAERTAPLSGSGSASGSSAGQNSTAKPAALVETAVRSAATIKHGRRALIFGGALASATKANDVFSLEICQGRQLPPGQALPKPVGDLTVEEIGCKNNCSGHGQCPSGSCTCDHGWTGVDCSVAPPKAPVVETGFGLSGDYAIVSPSGEGCPDACNGRGDCHMHAAHGDASKLVGKCVCRGHWQGPTCNRRTCLNGCSGQGVCHNGTCSCFEGFEGTACEVCKCQHDCHGNGECDQVNGICGCRCAADFTGPFCGTKVEDLPVKVLGRAETVKPMTKYEIPPPKPEPEVDQTTGKTVMETITVQEIDQDTGEENSVEKEIPVMKPVPPPVTIILPPVDSADYFSEAPAAPVKSGESTMGLSCKAGAVFQAGDQIILGMGTSTVEVMTIKELSMDPSCMDEAGDIDETNVVPCKKGPNGDECSGAGGECVAGECICALGYDGDACETFLCSEDAQCLNGGACNATSSKCSCVSGFSGPQCNATAAGKDARFKASAEATLAPKTKSHVSIKCIRASGEVETLNAEMVTEGKPTYDLCTFFCADHDDPTNMFRGACQINQRRFSPGGAVYVDLVDEDGSGSDGGSVAAAAAAATTTTTTTTTNMRFQASSAQIKSTKQTTVTFTGPTKSAHAATTPIYRNLKDPNPPKPEAPPKPKGKPCGIPNTLQAVCYQHGKCNKDGKCECSNPEYWGGKHCGVSQCHRTCNSVGGQCKFDGMKGRYECECFLGWGGKSCFTEECPGNCTTHLNYGKCADLRLAPYNATSVAAANRKDAGKQLTYKCDCMPGFSGEDCSKTSGCGGSGHECGDNGKCVEDSCVCTTGWAGPECNVNVCPKNCSNHGTCAVLQPDYTKGADQRTDRRCVCEGGWKGPACDILDECGKASGNVCSGHGACKDDEATSFAFCECETDYGGSLCERYEPHQCPVDKDSKACGGPSHGLCVTKATEFCKSPPCCKCVFGFYGAACDSTLPCEDDCNKHGVCENGACRCAEGWQGATCAEPSECPKHDGRICGFHGKCDRGFCKCDEGFEGPACAASSPCPNDCNGAKQGECIKGKCQCRPGWDGADCSWSTDGLCPDGCNGHGICQESTAHCYCNPGWVGETCKTRVECPKWENRTCAGNGVCQYGRCYCREGYEDFMDCRAPDTCSRDESGKLCSGNGICLKGTCYCAQGFWGAACARGSQCENECSRNGFCNNGKCQCDLGFQGRDCSEPVTCPGIVTSPIDNTTSMCNGNGRCFKGRCMCAPGFMGEDCAMPMPCSEGCSENGHCQDGVCICNAGWRGANCTDVVPCEPADCNGRGVCMLGTCNCREGWTGASCQLEMPCPNDCSNRGTCYEGKCVCDFGFRGVDCSAGGHLKVELFGAQCPQNCTGHGTCDNGQCICNLDWVGRACEDPLVCPNNCTGHGLCHHGTCFCDPGFNGTSCAIFSGCLGDGVDCSGHGVCSHGQCFCDADYHGDGCELSDAEENGETQEVLMEEECPNDGGDVCSGHGQCMGGICECSVGYYGVMCNSVSRRDAVATESAATAVKERQRPADPASVSLVEQLERSVPKDTAAKARFRATSKAAHLLLASNRHSAAVRAADASGDKECPSGCSGHGDCDETKGDCLCQSGWAGLDCSRPSMLKLEKESGLETSSSVETGAAVVKQTGGGGCVESCNPKRGKCMVVDSGEMQCKCNPGSMWANGNADGSANLKACDRELCPKRCGMDDQTGLAKGVCTQQGRCECDIGYGGEGCEVECPNRCSSHGRCDKNMASNEDASYHCFCESPWTGAACDKTAHASMVVNSLVIVAIVTFVMGLCCIPLAKEYWQQREQQRYKDIIKGDSDLRDQIAILRSSN